MMNFINEYLGAKKLEAILVGIILLGLVLLFKDNVVELIKPMLFSEMDSMINQIVNNPS